MNKLDHSSPNLRGQCTLVGAGPGDPELLTRKAERLIRTATVVFYDALVGPEVLTFAAPTARLVHVGKRSGRHSKDQKTIDRLIVEAALAGENISNPAALPLEGTANYAGFMTLNLPTVDGRQANVGDLNLAVDFGATSNQVSGGVRHHRHP